MSRTTGGEVRSATTSTLVPPAAGGGPLSASASTFSASFFALDDWPASFTKSWSDGGGRDRARFVRCDRPGGGSGSHGGDSGAGAAPHGGLSASKERGRQEGWRGGEAQTWSIGIGSLMVPRNFGGPLGCCPATLAAARTARGSAARP